MTILQSPGLEGLAALDSAAALSFLAALQPPSARPRSAGRLHLRPPSCRLEHPSLTPHVTTGTLAIAGTPVGTQFFVGKRQLLLHGSLGGGMGVWGKEVEGAHSIQVVFLPELAYERQLSLFNSACHVNLRSVCVFKF